MFPGGLDPDQWERVKTALQRAWSAYEGAVQNLMQVDAYKRELGHYAALQQALENMPQLSAYPLPPEAVSSLQNAAELLNSPGFLERLERARQAGEMAEQRLGPDGLIAAHQLAAHDLATGTGLERGAERILNGHADEILDEASAIASSPEARQAIEQADKDALIELAQQQAEQDSRAFEGEGRAGLDVETGEISSEVDRPALLHITLQLVRVLVCVYSAEAIVTGAAESELEQILYALGGVYALLEIIKAEQDEA